MKRGIRPGYHFWTPEDDEILCQHFETNMATAKVAELVGHPVHSVFKRAYKLGLKRPTQVGHGRGERTVHALTLAARPGGVCATETGFAADYARLILARLARKGYMHKGQLGHRTMRYFTSTTHRDKWVAEHLPKHLAQAANRVQQKAVKAGPWAADAPMVITPHTKFTYAPPPPAMVFRTNTHAA